jgi:general secretion pathway protein B
MSLILEALRKSEAERRRGQVPDIHRELPVAPAMRRSPPQRWWWAGATLLAATLVIVGMHVWRSATSPKAPQAPATPVRSTSPAAAALPRLERLSPQPAAVAARPPAPIDEHATTRAAPSRMPAAPAAIDTRPAPAPAPQPPPAAPTHTAPVDDTLALSDLSVDERKALPPLKLSMHMWNDDPSQRFVILDDNRLREGDRIGDAVVTAITTDGVVLDWNGRKLKLPIR